MTEVTNRLKRAFDADRVTRGFYTEFKAQHDALLAFLKALPEDVRSWYASVTLNRLMFVYSITSPTTGRRPIDAKDHPVIPVLGDQYCLTIPFMMRYTDILMIC